jgi:hypothetical protein
VDFVKRINDNPMKTKIILLLAVAVTAAVVNQPVHAGAIHSFVITENSPTSLTVTYDATALIVTFVNLDTWTFALPAGFLSSDVGGLLQWTEPENSNLANQVSFGSAITRAGFVASDHSILNQFPINANSTSVEVGTDGGVPVFATFNDNAAGSETAAPDTGSTLGLLSLALTAVSSAIRLRSRQSS